MNIHSFLEELSAQRPVFANEADFQHALAWQFQLAHPDAKIRFEMKPSGSRIYLDLVVTYQSQLDVEVGGEFFSLSDDSAQDTSSYDILKDVQRLEKVVSEASWTSASRSALRTIQLLESTSAGASYNLRGVPAYRG